MNVASFVAGYRLGHDGKPPALSKDMLERELIDIETRVPSYTDIDDAGWAWHLIGWTVGQAFAEYHMP